jgi:uncharacterized membrane-anchored protein
MDLLAHCLHGRSLRHYGSRRPSCRLGVPYFVSTALFAVSLAAIFAPWYLTEKTLSIHSFYTNRREVFCWAAVVATLRAAPLRAT